ncbi:hypothetical protein EYC98_01850 [Halieaceae bacterium IMCC14734]|uniref:CDP-glycerol:poly(Glycerophosphate) glycerophosphotransferase n=1 Tax=Candidatus Litorirhabdus singularis TaxID=2518993 RepID=A0ABT3TBG8_9GAMM|nr:CDP-glycerol glycerophosphotransferase family protein [Candidatus Litorirhabdus singularis]MCX2979600.1 hypothetical protein [Candidatus Litorirhabdus singularis]
MKAIRGLFRVLKNLLLAPLYVLSIIWPKDNNLWVFGAWMGARYSDNAAALFEHMQSEHSGIDIKWISKAKSLVKELRQRDIDAYYYLSFRGIYYQLRAAVAVYTHSASSEFFGHCISSSTLKVNVWHGTPIKRIGADDAMSQMSISDFILIRVFRIKLQRNDLFIASSEPAAKIYASAFNLDKGKILITGEPRSDLMLKGFEKRKYSDSSSLSIIYAPTFRNGVGSTFDFFGDFIGSLAILEEKLRALNTVLSLRLHPVNEYSAETIAALESCQFIQLEQTPELSSVVNKYDCLLTDFSSLIFDFALLDKSIYFLTLDLQSYLTGDRQLYVNFEDFTSDYRIAGWHDLVSQLPAMTEAIRSGEAGSPGPVKDYSVAFRDGRNSDRVVKGILQRLA